MLSWALSVPLWFKTTVETWRAASLRSDNFCRDVPWRVSTCFLPFVEIGPHGPFDIVDLGGMYLHADAGEERLAEIVAE